MNQKWILIPSDDMDGYFRIASASNTTFVLDAAGAAPKAGANVSIWIDNGGKNQLWKLSSNEPAPATYAVTFDANGGTGEVPTMAAQAEGAKLTLPAPDGLTAPAGKVFGGWVASTDGKTYEANNTKPQFQYTMTAEAVTFSAKWVDYFTVTVRAGNGDVVAEKSYGPEAFAGLASASDDPQSRMFFKGDVWNVSTAATYVTLDDLLADAAGSEGYKLATLAGDAEIQYGTEGFSNTFTAEGLRAASNFYPAATPTGTDAAGAVAVTPCFALTEFSGAVETTAADRQAANVAAANGGNAPRFICGITEAEFAAQTAAGRPSVTGCTFLTVTLPPVTDQG
jgi:hypothetical protein